MVYNITGGLFGLLGHQGATGEPNWPHMVNPYRVWMRESVVKFQEHPNIPQKALFVKGRAKG